ncbi:hypothetical protein [Salipaludibacillus neizhouensis]|uniref:hypothetical protein n=1 Tax=Salipaludibacillus neizhouensis TaxID=885475 RepID=UPI001C7D6F6D|nr:hypothetical protein [Salipaludibacillus neizhouensis]
MVVIGTSKTITQAVKMKQSKWCEKHGHNPESLTNEELEQFIVRSVQLREMK